SHETVLPTGTATPTRPRTGGGGGGDRDGLEVEGGGRVFPVGPLRNGRTRRPGRMGTAGHPLRQRDPAERAGGYVAGVEDEALRDIAVHVRDDGDEVPVVLALRADPGRHRRLAGVHA